MKNMKKNKYTHKKKDLNKKVVGNGLGKLIKLVQKKQKKRQLFLHHHYLLIVIEKNNYKCGKIVQI